jgi:hypothetical protein
VSAHRHTGQLDHKPQCLFFPSVRHTRPSSDASSDSRCLRESDLKFTDVYAQAGFGEQFTSLKVRTGDFKAGVSKYAVRCETTTQPTPSAPLGKARRIATQFKNG